MTLSRNIGFFASKLDSTGTLTGATYSTNNSVSAAGTTQGTGTALTSDYNIITTAAASSGVVLPTATTGRRVVVVNKGANALAVYPAAGGAIDALAANAAISIPVSGWMEFNASSTTQWYSTYNITSAGGGGSMVYPGSGIPNSTGSAWGTSYSTSGSGTVVALTTAPALSAATVATNAAVSAAGTSQGTGTALTNDYNIITTAAASSGVVLPTATTGRKVIVVNKGANAIAVYPATGGTIDALAANASISIPVSGWMEFNAASTTQWYSTYNITSAGGGGGGSVTISNDVVSSSTFYPTFSSATSGTASTINTSNTNLQYIPSTGTLSATIFNSLSDKSKKTNIVDISNAINTVKKIDGVEFDWTDNGKHSAGVIAQQLEEILPHLVDENADGLKSVNYSGLIGYLIQSIKELSVRIEYLEQK